MKIFLLMIAVLTFQDVRSQLIHTITMDRTGDVIQLPYNSIRNYDFPDETIIPTTEQGTGYEYLNGTLVERKLRKVSNQKRGGSHSLFYDLPKRVTGVPYEQNNKDRLESNIISRDTDIQKYIDNVHYSGFSLLIPSGKAQVSGWFVIHQWHQSSPESPPIVFELAQGHHARLVVKIRYGENKRRQYAIDLPRVDNNSGDKFMDLPRNKWIDFGVKWKLGPNGGGQLEVYRYNSYNANGFPFKIFDYSGKIGYTSVTNESLSENFGIYRQADYNGGHAIYYDNISVGRDWDSVLQWNEDNCARIDDNGVYFPIGCNMSNTSSRVGVDFESHHAIDQIVIYPNPTNNSISVAAPQGTEIKSISVLTMKGKPLLHQSFETNREKHKMDVSELQPTGYLLKIVTDTSIKYFKILIE